MNTFIRTKQHKKRKKEQHKNSNILDHSRSATAGLSFVLKCGLALDPIYSFGDIAIFIFCGFGWKLPIYAHFRGVSGVYFPQIWSPIALTPKMTILARKHVV